MQGDLRNMKDVAAAVAGADCVWHAAWKQTQTFTYGTLVYLPTFTIKNTSNVDNVYPTWMIWGNKQVTRNNMSFFCGWCYMGRERAMRWSWWCDLLDPLITGSSGAHPLHTFRMSNVLIF